MRRGASTGERWTADRPCIESQKISIAGFLTAPFMTRERLTFQIDLRLRALWTRTQIAPDLSSSRPTLTRPEEWTSSPWCRNYVSGHAVAVFRLKVAEHREIRHDKEGSEESQPPPMAR